MVDEIRVGNVTFMLSIGYNDCKTKILNSYTRYIIHTTNHNVFNIGCQFHCHGTILYRNLQPNSQRQGHYITHDSILHIYKSITLRSSDLEVLPSVRQISQQISAITFFHFRYSTCMHFYPYKSNGVYFAVENNYQYLYFKHFWPYYNIWTPYFLSTLEAGAILKKRINIWHIKAMVMVTWSTLLQG